MKILQTDFFGDSNIGIFSKVSDKFLIIGNTIQDKEINDISKILKTEILKTTISNSEIIGIFSVINSNGIILPRIVTDSELKSFKSFGKENDINIGVINSVHTSVGNTILCNDKGAIVSKLISSNDCKIIKDCLSVEIDNSTIANLNSVGSCGIATNEGCVIHRDSEEEEINKVQEILHVETNIGTANFGSPFIGSCVIGNSNAIVVGNGTTGPEITRIMETFNLI